MKKLLMVFLMGLTIYSGYGALHLEAHHAWQNQQVVVQYGDTLWSIADGMLAEGEDIREVVYRIEQTNKLQGNAYLQPGQKLIVPVRVKKEKKLLAAAAAKESAPDVVKSL